MEEKKDTMTTSKKNIFRKKRKIALIIYFAIYVVTIILFLVSVQFESIISVLLFGIILLEIFVGTGYIGKKDEKYKGELESNRLYNLKIQYSKYSFLVNDMVREYLEKMDDKKKEKYGIAIETNYNYLTLFEEKLNWVKTNVMSNPDSFVIATCLMYSLIESHRLEFQKEGFHSEAMTSNIEIALNCALKIISEPITYYQDDKENWISEKHSKVEIRVPEGIRKDCIIYDSIVNTLMQACIHDIQPNIMQFANVLHLIYCCQ